MHSHAVARHHHLSMQPHPLANKQSAMFQHALWGYDMSAPLTLPHVADGLFTFLSLEFLSAGLFITTRELWRLWCVWRGGGQ